MELRNDIWDNLGMTEEQKAAAVAPIDAKLAALGFRIAPPAGGGITAALILDDARRSNPSADNASLVAWIRDQYRGATPEEMVEVTKAIESLSGQTQEAPTATPAPKAAAIVPRRSNRVDLTTYNPFSDMAALLPGMKRGLEIKRSQLAEAERNVEQAIRNGSGLFEAEGKVRELRRQVKAMEDWIADAEYYFNAVNSGGDRYWYAN